MLNKLKLSESATMILKKLTWGVSIYTVQDCRFRFAQTSAQKGSLHKAFQKQTLFAFWFFAPRLFTKASFRHSLETKKPLICMRGFVANIGASLEEFAGDIRAILDAKLKNR